MNPIRTFVFGACIGTCNGVSVLEPSMGDGGGDAAGVATVR
jgi:hypothetical protein